ncbi:MAG: RluA family pseudouridine synthase [Planctomycetota bacterium]|jgi:23S rRNA pseudouridine1911/1915/1917 synthase|nr:RluA family pseudouridine synthase [Planctomycetota bacterium]
MGKIPIHLFDNLEYREYDLVIRAQPTQIRLDNHVFGRFGYLSRTYIQKLIKWGEITVNGEAVRPSKKIHVGDNIHMRLPELPERVIEPEKMKLDILHEDEDILVINKPRDLACHAGKKYYGGTLANAVIYHLFGTDKDAGKNNPGIVHRLDKNTTGVMVLAKNPETHRSISRQFASGTTQKEYLAVIKGQPRKSRGVIDSPIGYHPYLRHTMSVRMDAKGKKEAVTRYSVLEEFESGAAISLLPKTGRTHQLRVHLESIGHPMYGEDRYSGRYKKNEIDLTLGRQALHAWRLTIEHPATREEVTYEAPIPSDLTILINELRAG